jgi:hypothetical protein
MIINLASAPVEKPLTFAHAAPTAAETWLFDKDHLAVQVDAPALAEVSTLTLPAESITLLIVELT